MGILSPMRDDFIDGLEIDDLNLVKRCPKSDLHIHSTLSASVQSTSQALGVEITPAPNHFDGLQPFFRYYDENVKPHLDSPERIAAVICAGIEDAISDGVTVELNLDEVQHGIRAADSESVMREIRRRSVRVNVCPTSNIVLGGARSYQTHPIRKLADFGVHVSINSDDPLVFHTSVSREYLRLYRSGVFTSSELNEIRLKNLQNSHCNRPIFASYVPRHRLRFTIPSDYAETQKTYTEPRESLGQGAHRRERFALGIEKK